MVERPNYRVILIDDHPLIRAGVASALQASREFILIGEAGDAAGARQLVSATRPDLAILDLVLGDADGLTLLRELINLHRGLRVVVLTMLDHPDYERRARAAGALGFLHKSAGLDALLPELERVARLPAARSNADAGPASTTPSPPASDPIFEALTDRELQVFTLVGRGRSSAEIGEALGISPRTVDAHKEHIKRRLGLAHAAELSTRAARWLSSRHAPDLG